jgi:hypothetical protein
LILLGDEDVLAGGTERVEGEVRVVEGDLEHGPSECERGAQFVGGVGDEAALGLERGFQPGEQVVDGVGEASQLVVGAAQRQAFVQVSLGDLPSRVRHETKRSQHPAGDDPSEGDGDGAHDG